MSFYETAKKRTFLIVSKRLDSQGGVVSVVSMLMKNFSNELKLEHFSLTSKLSYPLPLSSLFYSVVDCVRLLSKVLTGRYDGVLLNTSLDVRANIRDSTFLLFLSLFGWKNTVVFIHGWDVKISRLLKKNRILSTIYGIVLNRSRLIIVLANSFKEDLVALKIPSSKIRVTTTMIEADQFSNFETRNEKKSKMTFLFLSRFQKEKGVFETIHAFSLIASKYPNIYLVMAGDGPEFMVLKKMVKEKNLDDRIDFSGYVRDEKKLKILKTSDIFVFPTYYREGCPVSLLEAMASGLAVITTPVGAIPDIVKNNINGILLENTNPETIATAMEKLVNEPENLNKIKSINHTEAIKKYNALEVSSNIEKFLTDTIATK